MTTVDKAAESAAARWAPKTIHEYLTDAARSIGVGSATDAGISPNIPPGLEPIQLTGGIPDPATLPVAALEEAIRKVLRETPEEALRYGGFQGYEPLRRGLAEWSTRVDCIPQGPENFAITSGAAGAIDAICSTFIKPGDVVVAESPTFSGSLRTFRGHLARLMAVPVDEEGLSVDALEALLVDQQTAGDPVKALYTIPNYQNPTGTYLSLPRRERLIDLSARFNFLIIEDDAYGQIRFDDPPLPDLYTIAEGHGVLRAATFSKTIATGLRVGWIQGRADFVEACVRMQLAMGGSPLIHQALAELVNSGQWEAHTEKMRGIYALKCEALSRSVREFCEPYVRFQQPRGGFFLWLKCAEGIDAPTVVRYAIEEGAALSAGRGFFMDGGGASHLRLAYSTATLDELSEAGKRLAVALARAAD